jgi:hypothetical protein
MGCTVDRAADWAEEHLGSKLKSDLHTKSRMWNSFTASTKKYVVNYCGNK